MTRSALGEYTFGTLPGEYASYTSDNLREYARLSDTGVSPCPIIHFSSGAVISYLVTRVTREEDHRQGERRGAGNMGGGEW